jgi:large subunit ribosomal protein L24e
MKCSYCTVDMEKGTGFMYVRKNGAIKYYCSKRCYRLNTIHNRKPNKKEMAEKLAKHAAK